MSNGIIHASEMRQRLDVAQQVAFNSLAFELLKITVQKFENNVLANANFNDHVCLNHHDLRNAKDILKLQGNDSCLLDLMPNLKTMASNYGYEAKDFSSDIDGDICRVFISGGK